jgi:hypothetical protein
MAAQRQQISSILMGALLIIITIHGAYGQKETLKEQEEKLYNNYSLLIEEVFSETRDYDSIVSYNDNFEKNLYNLLNETPSSLDHDFSELQEYVKIITSEDGNFRIYSWDTWTGGTMHFFSNIFQYKSGDSVYTVNYNTDEEFSNFYLLYYSEIYTLKGEGDPVYLVLGGGQFSTKDAMQSIQAYTIHNHKIDTVDIFVTNNGFINEIEVYYDVFSLYDSEREDMDVIVFNEKDKTIEIPIVYEEGIVTGRNIVYHYTKPFFEFKEFKLDE